MLYEEKKSLAILDGIDMIIQRCIIGFLKDLPKYLHSVCYEF